MMQLFDQTSVATSKVFTKAYSTSFSLGIKFLNKRFHHALYSIYGYVRVADEIVDTFQDYNREELIKEFREDTIKAIETGVSTNPVLHAFQKIVHEYDIEWSLIDTFLRSMEMDLNLKSCDRENYEEYILGSAEVVGLMCLRVFVEGNAALYEQLKPAAMKLGAAFQKVNFLRDLKADYNDLGRTYFPGVDLTAFDQNAKNAIEEEIKLDFAEAYKGIKQLPKSSRFGVYIAYVYYIKLFHKIKSTTPTKLLQKRVRIPNERKYLLFVQSYCKHRLNLI